MFEIRQIEFELLKNYWEKENHFKSADKKIVELVRSLGPYYCALDQPKKKCYGLYENTESQKLIGATQIYEFYKDSIRYRTLNLIKEFRGFGLGLSFLKKIIEAHWSQYENLIAWVRPSHIPWSLKNGFIFYESKIQEPYLKHQLMYLPIKKFVGANSIKTSHIRLNSGHREA